LFRMTAYVVLIGDVGTGKSTIVEKLTGATEYSSNADESFTRESTIFVSDDGRLTVADTPGSNAMQEKLAHNMEIAAACNFGPVSRIFLVTKAEPRIDNVVGNFGRYADHFMDLDPDIIAAFVTHMDTVTWTKERLRSCLDSELGMGTVVFSGVSSQGVDIQRDILQVCNKTFSLTIDDAEIFHKMFKINNNNRKIVFECKKQVDFFRGMKEKFAEQRKNFGRKVQIDLAFEFQAFMTMEIENAKQAMAASCGFDFLGENAHNEVGHIANMVNQLRAILHDIRIETLGYAPEGLADENMLRKCPHCGLTWAKIAGCDGKTTCGNAVASPDRANAGQFATFRFSFSKQDSKLHTFNIVHAGTKKTTEVLTSEKLSNLGCGKDIVWKEMRVVPIPVELLDGIGKITTEDIKTVPEAAGNHKKNMKEKLREKTNKLKKKKKIGGPR